MIRSGTLSSEKAGKGLFSFLLLFGGGNEITQGDWHPFNGEVRGGGGREDFL